VDTDTRGSLTGGQTRMKKATHPVGDING